MENQQFASAKDSKNLAVFLGVAFILTGLLFNKWSIERVFVADEHLTSSMNIAAIVCFQVGSIILGLYFLLKRPRLLISVVVRYILFIGIGASTLLGGYGNLRALGIINPHRKMLEVFRSIQASEELILALTPQLKKLNKSVMNLKFPDHQSHQLFEAEVTALDLVKEALPSFYTEFFPSVAVGIREWKLDGETRSVPLDELQMYQPFLQDVAYFEYAKFKIKKGHFIDDSHDNYESIILFSGTAEMKSGQLFAIKSQQIVRWRKQPGLVEDKGAAWRIYDWRIQHFKTIETDQKLFTEVLDSVLVDSSDLARARDSIHEQLVLEFLLDKKNFKKPHENFQLVAFDRHPGLSVVDLDRDGYDDIYVMARWGENMFFHNRGDGTFKEIAAELGLNIKDHTSCANFGDFDNDGDTDVFLGRTLARSVYLVNEDGRFVDQSDLLVDVPLPYFASSISAVDYNGDGLLDIYITTYAADMITKSIKKQKSKFFPISRKNILEGYLPEADVKHFNQLINSEEYHQTLHRHGPPNVLLKNIGEGRFEVAKESPELRVFRNTFQATWSDFDGDGKPDVYMASDFSPNHMFHNTGNGKFVDVTEETGTADIGFGMGAAWGDYNNDGLIDLYSTNMYSKAGRRITEQIPGLDARFAQMARGNSLFRNSGNRFEKVSGLTPPYLMVEEGGWGWGSQFLDVDNDGYLDIYALSGYYTAPKEVAIPIDS